MVKKVKQKTMGVVLGLVFMFMLIGASMIFVTATQGADSRAIDATWQKDEVIQVTVDSASVGIKEQATLFTFQDLDGDAEKDLDLLIDVLDPLDFDSDTITDEPDGVPDNDLDGDGIPDEMVPATASINLYTSCDDGGVYSLNYWFISWGDGETDEGVLFLIPGVPHPAGDIIVNHSYTETGHYNITVKAGVDEPTYKRYNQGSYEFTLWNHTMTGIFVDADDVPVSTIGLDEIAGDCLASNATDADLALIDFDYNGVKVFDREISPGRPVLCWGTFINNGDQWVMFKGLSSKVIDPVTSDPTYTLYRADPIYFDSPDLDIPYSDTIDLASNDDFHVIATPTDQNQHELTQTFASGEWGTKTATLSSTWTKDTDFIRLWTEALYSAFYPTQVQYDGIVTSAEATFIYAHQSMAVDMMTEFIQIPPTSENWFYLDGLYYTFDTDASELLDYDGFVGEYTIDSIIDDSLTGPATYSQENLTSNMAFHLVNADVDDSKTWHTARWKMGADDSHAWNWSYSIKAPTGWYVDDFEYGLWSNVTYDQPTQTVTYRPYEFLNLPPDIIRDEFVEVEFKKTSTAPDGDGGDGDGDGDGTGGETETESHWYDWVIDYWYVWTILIIGIGVLIYILWVKTPGK